MAIKTSDAPALPGGIQPDQLPSCGDFDIRIAADGTWFYRGSPIGRKPLVKLFSTVLRREADGRYWLVTPVERGEVTVDDAPFVITAVEEQGCGREQLLWLTSNVDERFPLDAAHPLRLTESADGTPRPYVQVRDGMEALILRSVFYHLVALGESHWLDGSEQFGLWSGGLFHRLGPLA